MFIGGIEMARAVGGIVCLAAMGIAGLAYYYYASTLLLKKKKRILSLEELRPQMDAQLHIWQMTACTTTSHYYFQLQITLPSSSSSSPSYKVRQMGILVREAERGGQRKSNPLLYVGFTQIAFSWSV